MSDYDDDFDRDDYDDIDSWVCEACGSYNDGADLDCPDCGIPRGADFADLGADDLDGATESCVACGEPVPYSDDVCPSCGAPNHDETVDPPLTRGFG